MTSEAFSTILLSQSVAASQTGFPSTSELSIGAEIGVGIAAPIGAVALVIQIMFLILSWRRWSAKGPKPIPSSIWEMDAAQARYEVEAIEKRHELPKEGSDK